MNKLLNKNNIFRYVKSVFGMFLIAISFNLFFLPNNIVFGGVSGLSIIVKEIYGINPISFIIISSIFCLLLSFIFLDKKKTSCSILGTILLPIFIKMTSKITLLITLDLSDQLLIAFFGGVIYGIGAGIVFKSGFTTGGTDIINQILSKYLKVSIGTSMLIIDGAIVVLGAFIFGITKFMYAVIIVYIISFLTDKILLGISNCKSFYIITEKEEEISSFVINELGHTITVFSAKGGFTNQKTSVLFTVIPTKEYYKFKNGIKEIDKNAFFTVIDSYEVMGGF